ncbi:uroporphyrinogen-III synthase [Lujinxingia litoralis]|nr:uroporphyrinogen-III synthase [Lujinxingia litoralis]
MTLATPLRILDTGLEAAGAPTGADLHHCPALRVNWLRVENARLRALLNTPHHLIFYSAHAVESVLHQGLLTPEEAREHHLIAVGPLTAQVLANAFHVPVSVPERHYFESLIELLQRCEPRDVLAMGLKDKTRDLSPVTSAWGVAFHEVPVYETEPNCAALARALAELAPDWVTVTSSRGAEALRQALPEQPARLPRIAAIGPRTAERLAELQLPADLIAPSPDRTLLIEAILQDSP